MTSLFNCLFIVTISIHIVSGQLTSEWPAHFLTSMAKRQDVKSIKVPRPEATSQSPPTGTIQKPPGLPAGFKAEDIMAFLSDQSADESKVSLIREIMSPNYGQPGPEMALSSTDSVVTMPPFNMSTDTLMREVHGRGSANKSSWNVQRPSTSTTAMPSISKPEHGPNPSSEGMTEPSYSNNPYSAYLPQLSSFNRQSNANKEILLKQANQNVNSDHVQDILSRFRNNFTSPMPTMSTPATEEPQIEVTPPTTTSPSLEDMSSTEATFEDEKDVNEEEKGDEQSEKGAMDMEDSMTKEKVSCLIKIDVISVRALD